MKQTKKEMLQGIENDVKQQADVIGSAIIDIEFTGLDNSFIGDNEIIQVKILNVSNQQNVIRNFKSKKPLSAHTQLEHKVVRYEDCPVFDLNQLVGMLTEIGLSVDADFFGFGVEQDKKMLAKYGCHVEIEDIRTYYQKTEFAYRMATEGSGLEETYFIVIGEYPPAVSHSDFSEMILIKTLFEKMKDTEAESYMSVVPFGHCSGMTVSNYVQNYRRAADGYRYNNSDDFSLSLSNAIEELEYANDDDDWD